MKYLILLFVLFASACAVPPNIYQSIREDAKNVVRADKVPKKCIDLGEIRLLDYPLSDIQANRSLQNYFTNITGRRGGDTFIIKKAYKTEFTPEKVTRKYLNGVANAYRCKNKNGFQKSAEFDVLLAYKKPSSCQLVSEKLVTDGSIDYVEGKLRKMAVSENANYIYVKKVETVYAVLTGAASYYDAEANLYKCSKRL